jgi:predicted Rossmann fold nucleotide-binding protein DprA/Smf involved in DNA uptake
MGIPLFVLSPKLFESNPVGNKELISMGAIEVTDYEKIHELIGKMRKNKKENMALF